MAPTAVSRDVAGLFATALEHHKAGRLVEAQSLYLRVLAIARDHVDSLHRLGYLAYQVRRYDMAAELIEAAIEIDGGVPAFHNDIGVVYRALGRTEEAKSHYLSALALKPDFADAHFNLANTLKDAGELDEAVAAYRQALAARPEVGRIHCQLGNALKDLGRPDEAAAAYRRAIDLEPHNADAHAKLSGILIHQGKIDEAIPTLRQAVALKPDDPAAYSNLGAALSHLGNLDEAIAAFRQAIATVPNVAEAHCNLGNALKQAGKVDEAVEAYRQAVAIAPDSPEFHTNLGDALKDQGRLSEAAACNRRALALNPDYAAAHNNLGNVFRLQGKFDEALACYRRAAALKPEYANAHRNVAIALIEQGDPAAALAVLRNALSLGETTELKGLFVACLRRQPLPEHDPDYHDLVLRAMTETWGRPRELVAAATALIKANPSLKAGLAGSGSDPSSRKGAFSDRARLSLVAKDRLLVCLLKSAPVCDSELEQFLTGTRKALLDWAEATRVADVVDDGLLEFCCALAEQCFVNEYVFALAGDESARANALWRAAIAIRADSGELQPLWLAVAAAYFPLHALPDIDSVLDARWPECFEALLTKQVREPRRELALRAAIPHLTAITNEVSLKVQRQYEENPYPRWVRTIPSAKAASLPVFLRARFPQALFRHAASNVRLSILIAGCGSGQESVEMARHFPDARILAVDLSLASLGYAKRMTAALGIDNVEYAQADLLQLGALDERFDVISTTGVLHHLADPFEGWRTLLTLLRGDGFMRVGLYSALARSEIVAVRKIIAAVGYQPISADIRLFRQKALTRGAGAAESYVATRSDFFTLSECRDLLFHVQEHLLSLPEIAGFLEANDLTFIGFETDPQIRRHYATRFPDDRSMTDLDCWNVFEQENPKAFSAMYQFWVQKA